MKTSLRNILTIAALTGLVIGFTGCASSSSGYKKGSQAASNIQKAADRIAALQVQIDQTLASLTDLVQKPQADLRPQFKKYASDMDKMEFMAKDVRKAAESMAGKGKAFFATWDKELAQINNENIQARSQTRKEEVAKHFDAIKEAYEQSETSARPFLSDLQDVRKFLGVDLTQGGLSAIKDTVTKANTSAIPLKESLSKLVAEFRSLGLAMSAAVPAAK